MIIDFIHILFIGTALYAISQRQSVLPQPVFWTFALFKISSGLIVALVFIKYESGGDTMFLYEKGELCADKLKIGFGDYLRFLIENQHPSFKSESRNLFFGKLISPFVVLTNHSFWLTNSYLSLVNFVCGFYLFQCLIKKYPETKNSAILAIFLLPSMYIWTSGIIKETLIVSFLFLLIIGLLHWPSSKHKLLNIGAILILIYLIFNIKYYILTPIFLALTILFISHLKKPFKIGGKTQIGIGIVFASVVIIASSLLQHHLQLSRIPESLYNNYQTITENSSIKNTFLIPFQSNWMSILLYSPISFFTGLFRPLIFEGSLSNAYYWLESIMAISFFSYSFSQVKRWSFSYALLAVIVSIFTLALFLPLATGNFGTLARYRVVFWPFFIFIISIFPLNDFVSFRQRIG